MGSPGFKRVPDHVRAAELNEPDRLLVLADALHKRGYETAAIEKIIGGNVAWLIRDVCG